MIYLGKWFDCFFSTFLSFLAFYCHHHDHHHGPWSVAFDYRKWILYYRGKQYSIQFSSVQFNSIHFVCFRFAFIIHGIFVSILESFFLLSVPLLVMSHGIHSHFRKTDSIHSPRLSASDTNCSRDSLSFISISYFSLLQNQSNFYYYYYTTIMSSNHYQLHLRPWPRAVPSQLFP